MSRNVDPKSVAGKAPEAEERFPLVVVGAGPAGCAAAIEAAELGLSVLLVDEHPLDPALIGLDVPYHFGQRADGSVQNRGRMVERLVETNPPLALAFERGVEVRLGVSVWGAFANGPTTGWLPEPMLGLADSARSWLVGGERLIVAAGRRDLGLAFPGWDRPGVMGVSALHALLDRYQAFAGRRLVILGSGTEALAAALTARRAGLEVAAVVEVAPEAEAPADLVAALAAADVPLLTSTVVVGTDSSAGGIEAVRLMRLDTDGTPLPGSERTIACDTIGLGIGVVPSVELFDPLGCRLVYRPELGGHVPVIDHAMRTSLPWVYAAGDCAGIWPAKSLDPELAAAEGRIAARHAAASLGHDSRNILPRPPVSPGPRLDRKLRAWTRAIAAASPEDVIVCQCEGVTRRDLLGLRPPRYLDVAWSDQRDLRTLLGDGPLSQDQVKRLTRAGMGPCQGRRCREQVATILALAGESDPATLPLPTWRPPLRPLPLAVLQDEREPATMREHWESWFGIPSQWTPWWEIERD